MACMNLLYASLLSKIGSSLSFRWYSETFRNLKAAMSASSSLRDGRFVSSIRTLSWVELYVILSHSHSNARADSSLSATGRPASTSSTLSVIAEPLFPPPNARSSGRARSSFPGTEANYTCIYRPRTSRCPEIPVR
ncbi:gp140 [Caviid betaherpesvirus 2]|uniref:Gp140 n=1 Tax=Guinea pig cytomegalovirus (strain 22122) TaxID=103920 RepID=B7TQ20_GPCMV|nr:gp140 [Caviid betaherpesvirus 2]AGE11594.1 gp140 [Caviid betaherpesvirus 2]AIL83979.1 gp140 [BAC cloning vector GPN13BACdenovo_preserved(MM)]BAJ78579.1 gp140 [Caviid betaherpesvirus 2]